MRILYGFICLVGIITIYCSQPGSRDIGREESIARTLTCLNPDSWRIVLKDGFDEETAIRVRDDIIAAMIRVKQIPNIKRTRLYERGILLIVFGLLGSIREYCIFKQRSGFDKWLD